MAKIVYIISNTIERYGFNSSNQLEGEIDLANDQPSPGQEATQEPATTPPLNITGIGTTSTSWSTTQLPYFSILTGNVGEYVSFRDTTPTIKYPTGGNSLDVWSQDLAEACAVSFSNWSTITSQNLGFGAGVYPLSSDKFTVLYDYSTGTSFASSRGGRISLTFVGVD